MQTDCLKHSSILPKIQGSIRQRRARIDPLLVIQVAGRWIVSEHAAIGQLEPDRQSGRQAKVTPLKVGRSCFEFIGLKAPPEQPHQLEINSHPEIFCKRRIRLGCCRVVFARVYGADQGLCKRPQPSNRGSASQTEQEISLIHYAVESAEISNHSKIAEVLFLYSCIPAIQVRTPS